VSIQNAIQSQRPPEAASLEAHLPSEMARACEKAGAAKAGRDALTLIVLGALAGVFTAFGAIFMTTVLAGTGDWPWGIARLLGGLAFSLGVILVTVGGAELFTGNAMMVVAYASGRITLKALLRAWYLVYFGNAAGAVAAALVAFLSGQYLFDGGEVGRTALMIGEAKAGLPTVPLFFLAILCNVLVCLAVWMSFGARSVAEKAIVVVPPIAAFVAAGFENSVANLYLLPYALAIKWWAGADFWHVIEQSPGLYADLTASGVLHNILVSSLGNLVGGSVLVGAVYWFVYLRPGTEKRAHASSPATARPIRALSLVGSGAD
jgi:formate/nitrite transporter